MATFIEGGLGQKSSLSGSPNSLELGLGLEQVRRELRISVAVVHLFYMLKGEGGEKEGAW